MTQKASKDSHCWFFHWYKVNVGSYTSTLVHPPVWVPSTKGRTGPILCFGTWSQHSTVTMSCSILSPLRPNYWHTTNAIPLVGWIHPHLWLACSPGLFKPDMTKHVCTCMGDLDCISDHCDSGYKIYIKLPFNQLSHFLHFVQYLSFSCVNVVHTPCGLEGLTWFRNFWQSLVRQKNVPSMFYMSCNQCLKSRRVPSQLNVTRADRTQN